MSKEKTVKVFCKANEKLCLTIGDDQVVLAYANHNDPLQHWIKKVDRTRPDANGHPSFALVNKDTGEAIQQPYGNGHGRPVRLKPFKGEFDESILWTKTLDDDSEFKHIRELSDTALVFDASQEHGPVHDGTELILWDKLKVAHQLWKIVDWDHAHAM